MLKSTAIARLSCIVLPSTTLLITRFKHRSFSWILSYDH